MTFQLQIDKNPLIVGGNLEQFCRVLQPVDFIQHHTLASQTVEKTPGVKHHAANAREFTVKIFNSGRS